MASTEAVAAAIAWESTVAKGVETNLAKVFWYLPSALLPLRASGRCKKKKSMPGLYGVLKGRRERRWHALLILTQMLDSAASSGEPGVGSAAPRHAASQSKER